MNYKPFDLEAAKRGEPIVNRKGDTVKFIAHVPEATLESRVLTVNDDGVINCNYENGKCIHDWESEEDLFMASKKIRGWINIYKDDELGECESRYWFNKDKEQADRRASRSITNRIACIEVEFEEGQGL